MYGTFLGNLAGTAYFLYFQLAGIFLAFCLLRREHFMTRLLMGSVFGSLLMHWFPVLAAFVFNFTLLAHMIAMIPLIPVYGLGIRKIVQNKERKSLTITISEILRSVGEYKWFLIILVVFMILWMNLLFSHSIPLYEDGAIYTGQCTYGDMNMHLGFITSIAVQGKFPPAYSIYPDMLLSYPFLSDSISSSLYVLGASLRYAYILPMVFAMLQIFGSVYLFAQMLFSSKAKAILTFIFYFLNGGLGFTYFMDWSYERDYRFTDIFTGFYTTPTNLVSNNIRWVNVIADMFLPQRATLFGFAMAFPCMFLLYKAVFRNKKKYFLYAGILAGSLPMIHTHSFLGIGFISASWLLLYLYDGVRNKEEVFCLKRKWNKYLGGILLTFFFIFMCLIQQGWQKGIISADILMKIGIIGIGMPVVYGCILLYRYCRFGKWRELFTTWGVYLLCALVLALPQLLFWTFGHVSESGFVRGYFNWGNQGDFYPWFYFKNIGLPLVLIVGAVFAGRKKTAALFFPAGVIWFLAELIVFTPNIYDNNKLLYMAYLLLCCGAADYGVVFYRQLKKIGGAGVVAAVFMFMTVFSAITSLGREVVSEYQLYGASHVKLAEYITENTQTDAVFLTDARHNNEIASLTGRNIVCGSDSYLYFHGIDAGKRRKDVRQMFEQPAKAAELFQKYHVDYVVISSYERANYQVQEQFFMEHTEQIFCDGDVQLYAIK